MDATSFDDMDYLTIIGRGHERRELINDVLSSNNKRRPCFRKLGSENLNVLNGKLKGTETNEK